MKTLFVNLYKTINNKMLFKILYLFASFTFITVMTYIPYIHVLTKISIAWGILLVPMTIYERFVNKSKPYIFEYFLYGFLLVTLAFNIICYPSGENLKSWLINLIIFTVFFSVESYKSKKELLKELNTISIFYVLLTFLLSLISFTMIIFDKKIVIELPRVWSTVPNELIFTGLFQNENALGLSAVISFVISLYLIFNCKNTKSKLFYSINLALQLITTVTSGGRSAFLVLAALIFVFIFINMKSIISRLAFILVPIATFSTWLYFNTDKIYSLLTGREALWETAWIVIKKNPFIGVGLSNMIPIMEENRVDYLRGIEGGGLHNIYIQITTVNGIFTTILFLLFILLTFLFFTRKIEILNSSDRNKYTILLSLFVGILLTNLMESSLVYIVSFISLIFWIYSSYLVSILDSDR